MDDQVKRPSEIMADFDPFSLGDEKPTSIEDFEPQIQEDVEGLMWLGHLEEEFTFAGHTFVIRTLKGDEELLASLVCKEFTETLGQARAWVWALISQSLVAIDGDENFCPPISNDKRTNAKARFQYCCSNWYWPVAAVINQHFSNLTTRQAEAIQRVEDLFRGNPLISMPFADSSTDSGDSEELPPQESAADYLDPDSTDSNSD